MLSKSHPQIRFIGRGNHERAALFASGGGKHLTRRASESPTVIFLRILLILSLLLPDLAAKASPLAESQEAEKKVSAERADPVEPARELEEADTKLAWSTSPEYAVSGETITLTWQLTPGDDLLALGKLEDQTLEIEAVEGLAPLGENASKFDPATRKLSLPLAEQGEVTWQVARSAALDFTQPLWIWGRILNDEKIFLETPLVVPVAEQFQVESTGGVVKTSQGLVSVSFPEKALTEAIDLQIRSPQSQAIASSLSGRAVEIVAESQKTGEALHQFQEPISISIPYQPEEITGDEASLTLFYYDEKAATWRPLASRVDRESKLLTGKSDHLSVFDFNTQNWEAAILPTLENFQVASFTGAASYSFPIQVPAGPGGLQPSLALSYNSQVVDGATTKTQASWVGMGWSLDTGYIARNMNGTNEYNGGNYASGTNIRMDDDWKSSGNGDTFTGTDGDDTFSLVLNGQSWRLLRIPDTDNNENTIEYRTAEESFYRIIRYHSHSTDPGYVYDYSYWKVWDKTGTTYTFQDRAWYPSWRTDLCAAPFMLTWQWSLSQVQNVFGKEISYQYTKQSLSKNHPWDDACSGYDALSDIAIVPSAILYPGNHYRIQFVRQNRTDYDTAWYDSLYYIQFEPWLLERIEVWQDPDGTWQNGDDKLVRKYLLGYNNGVIFPNLTWSAGGKTPGLASITEYGVNGAGSLPATSFTYDSMHLSEANNGYGGKVAYSYETAAWHEIESSADPLTPTGMEGDWIYPNNRGPGRCDDTAGFDKTVYPAVAVLHPGQVYKFSIKLHSPCLGEYNLLNPTSFGLWLTSNGSSKAVAAEEKQVTYLDSTTGTVTAYLRVPASISFGQFYINVTKNAILYEYRVWPVATRYRVLTKTVTDQVTNHSSTVTYKYDEAATNDAAHSEYISGNTDYYDKPYTQFLGHAMTQAIQPDGQVNTTFYNQGDHQRGMSSAQLVHTQDFSDDFDSLGSNWTFNAATESIPYLNGDRALNMTSDTKDYITSAARSAYSLTKGEMVLVQFRLQGAESGMRLRWEQASGYFGLTVLPTSHALWMQYSGANDVSLSGTLEENTWYKLLLTLDEEQMMVRVWKRDDPSTAKRAQVATPDGWENLTWRFRAETYKGTAWLDAYREGKLYSLQDSVDTSPALYDTISNNIPDLVPPNHANNQANYPGFEIAWTYPVQSTDFLFNGGTRWVGKRTYYHYETSQQDNAQYGNLTQVVESAWNGNSFVDYSATWTQYYPNAGTPYLVGLPGFVEQFRCLTTSQNGSCYADLAGISRSPYILSSHWYLYDGSNSLGMPTAGKLTGERTMLRWGAPSAYSDVRYGYDTWGNRTTVTAYPGEGTSSAPNPANAQVTTTTYDPVYRTYPIASVNALNQIEQAKYDYALGLPVVVTDTNGVPTFATYDAFGRMTGLRRDGDASNTLAFSYFIQSAPFLDKPFYTQVTQRVDATTTFTTRKYYNGLGQLLQTEAMGASVNGAPRDILMDTYYDANGRVASQSVPYDKPVSSSYHGQDDNQPATFTSYDPLDRVWTVTAPDGTPTTYAYQNTLWNGQLYAATSVTDGNGHTNQSLSDVWGRAVQVIPPTGPGVSYSYDAADRLVIAARGGVTTTLTYDLAGRKTSMDDPDMGVWKYEYDALGNLLTQKDHRCVSGSCVTIGMLYDSLNRLTQKTYTIPAGSGAAATSTVSYYYDEGGANAFANGRRTRMVDGSSSTTWTYDGRGRVTSSTQSVSGAPSYTSSWTYNSADLPVTMTYPNGEMVSFDYNAQMLLQGLSSSEEAYAQDTFYDAAGRITERALNDGGGAAELRLLSLDRAGRQAAGHPGGGGGARPARFTLYL